MINIKIRNGVSTPNPSPKIFFDDDGNALPSEQSEVEENVINSKPEIAIELPEKIDSPASLQQFCDEAYKNLYMFLQNYYKF